MHGLMLGYPSTHTPITSCPCLYRRQKPTTVRDLMTVKLGRTQLLYRQKLTLRNQAGVSNSSPMYEPDFPAINSSRAIIRSVEDYRSFHRTNQSGGAEPDSTSYTWIRRGSPSCCPGSSRSICQTRHRLSGPRRTPTSRCAVGATRRPASGPAALAPPVLTTKSVLPSLWRVMIDHLNSHWCRENRGRPLWVLWPSLLL